MDALDKLFSKVKKEQAPSQLTREILQHVSFKQSKKKLFDFKMLFVPLALFVFVMSGVGYSVYYQYYRVGEFPTTVVDNYAPKQDVENDKPPQVAVIPKTSSSKSQPVSTPSDNNNAGTVNSAQNGVASIATVPSSPVGAVQSSPQYIDIKINDSNNPPSVIFGALVKVSWISAGIKEDSCFVYGHNVPLDDGRLWLGLSSEQKSNNSFNVYAMDEQKRYVGSITLGVKCKDLSGNVIKDDITFQVSEI